MKDDKKISAAIAAVMHYIQEEEAILMQPATMAGMPPAQMFAPPVAAANPWAMNGRQTQMQLRNLMQMRTFR